MSLILLGDHHPFLQLAKLLSSQGHRFATLGGFASILTDIDIPARPLAEASAGLQDAALAEASRILTTAMVSPIHQDGLGPGPSNFISTSLPPFLYSRLADLAMLVLSLDVARPTLCILQNDVVPINRTVALWCKVRGVPCLHIPHAIYQNVNRGPAGTDVHDLVTASHLAAAGPYQREWYEERSEGWRVESGGTELSPLSTLHSPLLIRETGLPQFDQLIKELKRVSRERAQRLLKVNPFHPVVGYFSTWPQHSNVSGISDGWQICYLEFLKAAKRLQKEHGVQFIIKLHPGGGEANWTWHVQMAQQVGLRCALTPGAYTSHTHLVACMRASDLWLAYGGSNSVIDAAHIEGLRLASTHGYDGDEAVLRVPETAEGMYQAIGDALARPAPPVTKLLAKYVGDPDGKASERIAQWIGELVK